MSLSEEEIQSLWKNADFTGSFQSAKAFQSALIFDRDIHIPLNKIYKALSKIPEYLVLIKPMRHFDRRNYGSNHGFMKLVQIDLALMFQYRSYKNFLVLVDVFSHRIYGEAMTSKTASETVQKMEKIFKEIGMYPELIQSDMGAEFRSPLTQDYFKQKKIYWHGKTGIVKASVSEWAVFRIKKVLYAEMMTKQTKNWPRLLKEVIQKINNTPSPSLNFLRPSEISSPEDDRLVDEKKPFKPMSWREMRQNSIDYERKGYFHEGETVILDNKKKNFDKSYKPRVNFAKFVHICTYLYNFCYSCIFL